MFLKRWETYCWSLLFIFIIASIINIYASGFVVQRDLFSALPEAHLDSGFLKARHAYQDGLGRKMIFAVLGPTVERAQESADMFIQHLQSQGHYQNVQSKFDVQEIEKIRNFYFSYRQQLLRPEKIRELQGQSDEIILGHHLMKFYSPLGAVSTAALPSDPFSVLTDFLMSLNGGYKLDNRGGYLMGNTGKEFAVFVFADIAGEWHNFSVQNQAVNWLDRFQDAPLLRLGLAPYMKAGVDRAKVEISTIGTGSLLGAALLLLLLFQSVVPLLATTIIILFSMAIATLLTHLVFGSIHFFTLILGSSLVGLIVDYAFHFFAQRFENEVSSGLQAREKVKVALAYSFLSTILGFAFLIFTPFPVLQQMGIFAVVGFFSACLMIWTFFPKFQHRKLSHNKIWNQFDGILRYIKLLPRPIFFVLSLLVLIFTIGFLFTLNFNDDVKQLQSLPADLKSQEDIIKKMLGESTTQKYAIVRGATVNEMLQVEEQLVAKLQGDYNIRSYGISHWFPSEAAQHNSFELYQKLKPVIRQFYQKLNVPEPKMSNWLSSQDLEMTKIDFTNWLQLFSHLPVTGQYLGEIGGQHYTILNLPGLLSSSGLAELNSKSTQIVNPTDETSAIMGDLRVSLMWAGLLGVLLIGLVFMFLKGLSYVFYIMLAPVLASALSLILSCWILGSLNLFNILGAILVFSLGIDYSFFYYECRNSTAIPTLIAISACVVTTGLSFGLLALSQTAAISGFGVTILVGIAFSFIFAPIAMRST